MSSRFGFIQAFIVGAVLSGTALVSTDAFAQCCQGGSATGANAWTNGLETSAAWPADPGLWPSDSAFPDKPAPVPYWWTHGEIEVGGRDFLNDPTRGGSVSADTNPANFATGGYATVNQQSLAKYYEYSIVAPGAFGGGHAATGTSDGLYQVDLWANNTASNFAGFSDQSYLLTVSKIGEQYFTFSWDQTPHIYSTSAQTIFGGVGSNALTVPAGLVANPVSTTAVNLNDHAAAGGILPYLYGIDLGIQRNTAAVSYRATDVWTAWDARADYSYMTRTGTQPGGVVELQGFAPTNVPVPIDDRTQNFGANGEYLGTSLWGQKFTFKVGYTGSVYTDNISNDTVQNPFLPTSAGSVPTSAHLPAGVCGIPTAAAAGSANCGSAQMSTPPSNQANGFSETSTADLPFHGRYVGTTSYTLMTQNAAFLPMTNNPNAAASPNGVPWNSVAALPMQSLGGDINTLLSNNVITTQITPTLTSKLSYRYYGFDNETPRIIFPCWISYDQTGVAPTKATAPCGSTGFEDTISSLSLGYVKQNGGAELNWRPTKEWNFNLASGYEHYDYTLADDTSTSETSVKGSVDWKPTGWLNARASGYYSDRTEGNYSYFQNVVPTQFPTVGNYTPQSGAFEYSSAYQQFFLDNRQRTKADVLVDIIALPGVTITPSVKYKDDYYGLNALTQDGLSDQKSISAGVDVSWVITRDLSISASYYWESYNQLLYSQVGIAHGGPAFVPPPAAALFGAQVYTTDQESVNTVTAAIRWAAIPNTLDFDARYSYSFSVDQQTCVTVAFCTTGATPAVPFTAFPNDTTNFQRLDATATYKFNPDWVQQMGFKGDILARLRYTWERNSVANWQNDALAAFTDIPGVTGMTNAIWMAWDNPNYNVQMLAVSLVARW